MKTLLTLTTATLLLSPYFFVQAETFELLIDVHNNFGNIKVTENMTMSFPAIIVDESTLPGARCYTNDAPNELCKTSEAGKEDRVHGYYFISAIPETQINITLTQPTAQNGLGLYVATHPTEQSNVTAVRTLNAVGHAVISIYGFLELLDPSEVKTQETVFTFDIIASYD